jgi:hypothetical protein
MLQILHEKQEEKSTPDKGLTARLKKEFESDLVLHVNELGPYVDVLLKDKSCHEFFSTLAKKYSCTRQVFRFVICLFLIFLGCLELREKLAHCVAKAVLKACLQRLFRICRAEFPRERRSRYFFLFRFV